MNTYISELNKRDARPRSKRLRQMGASASGGAASTVVVSGGGSAITAGDGHTHANKKYLDQLTTDTDDYIYLTQNREVEDPDTGEVINERQTNKAKAGHADKAHDLDEDSPINDRFLRKDRDEETEHSLGVGGDLNVGGTQTVTGDSSVGGQQAVLGDSSVGGQQTVTGDSSVGGHQTVLGDSAIGGSQTIEGTQTVEGDQTINGDALIKGLLSLLTGTTSPDFLSGLLGTGFELRKIAETGRWRLEIDELLVRVVATFFELVIQKLRHVGGSIVLSPASMQCIRVEETADAYRCYFKASEGDKVVANEFVVGDQARCQSFNLKSLDGGGVRTTFYWRLVTAVGDDWIELSKTDCAELSGVPEAGDDIVHLGNRDDVTRQNAIILDTVGSDAPSIKQYHGINSYVLTDDLAITVFSSRGNRIRGQFVSEATGKDYDESITSLGDSISSIGEQMQGIKVNVDAIKEQNDKVYTLWFGTVNPTTSNAPASEWQTEEDKAMHVKDIYYNEDAGLAWNWMLGEDGAYYWHSITDRETLRALEKAAKAQDTADGKRRNFVAQPTDADAYDVGDTWSNATFGQLYDNDNLVCVTAKAAGAAFSISHWQPVSNATTAYIQNLGNEIRQVVSDNKTAGDQATAAAKAAADAAQKAANNAATAASNAQSTANSAATSAANAATAASKAQSTADSASTSASNAASAASKAQSTADSAQSAANSAQSAANNAQSTANEAKSTATANATAIVQTKDSISALAGKFTFDSNGNVTNVNQSGVVLTSQFASLYSEAVNKDTNVVKKAEISAMVTKDANGYLQSGVKIKADQINLEGYTTINGGFKVDANGNVEMNNATVKGVFIDKPHSFSSRVGKFYLNPTKGSVFIAKAQINSKDVSYYKLPSASTYAGRQITVVPTAFDKIVSGSTEAWQIHESLSKRYIITQDGFGALYNNGTSTTGVYVATDPCTKMLMDWKKGIYRFFSDGQRWYEESGKYDNLKADSSDFTGTFEEPID